MRSLRVIILTALFAKAYAGPTFGIARPTSIIPSPTKAHARDYAEQIVDKLADNLVDAFFDQGLSKTSSHFNVPRFPTFTARPASISRSASFWHGHFSPHARNDASLEALEETERKRLEVKMSGPFSRRHALAAGTLLGLGAGLRSARAAEDVVTLCGTAFPPGNKYGQLYPEQACDLAVYKFDYPANWEVQAPGEIDRTIKNMDARVVNPKGRAKGTMAFVTVQSRVGALGEGIEKYDLNDQQATLAGFTGGDPDLKDTLDDGEVTRTIREGKGFKYYEYDIRAKGLSYKACITDFKGRIFGLFVKASSSVMAKEEAQLAAIVSSFRMTGKA